jgi:hemerythrin-like domain-containing protein
MEEYLNMGIKEVIKRFPPAADVLNKFNIGCAPCSVGTCLLKDIVSIHSLAADEEKELLTGLAEIIFPGKKIDLPVLERKQVPKNEVPNYSPPVKSLVDEHKLIKRLVALIPAIADKADPGIDDDWKVLADIADFIKSYADRFHHAKEEDILFRYFDENTDIIKAMLQDHTNARAHVKLLLEGIEKKDKFSVGYNLIKYGEILSEHIKKEDEILYPWMDRTLTTREVGEMYTKFINIDNDFSAEAAKYQMLIESLEKKFKN